MLRVKYERLRRGLTQAQVSRLLHLAQPTTALIENGRLRPTTVQLERLGRIYQVAPDLLLREIELPDATV